MSLSSSSPKSSSEVAEHQHAGYWHTPLLAFPTCGLEKKYSVYFLERVINVDKFSTRLHVVVVAVLSIILLSRHSVSANVGGWLDVRAMACVSVLMTTMILHAVWVSSVSRGSLLRWRTVAVVGVRIITTFMATTGALVYVNPRPVVDNVWSWWWKAFFSTGSVNSIMLTLGFPLLFKHQLWFHTMEMVIQMMVLARRFCARVSCSESFLMDIMRPPGGDSYVVGGMTEGCCSPWPHCIGLHRFLSRCASLILNETGFVAAGPPPAPNCLCKSSILFLQIFMGWGLPLVILYFWERRSRANFLLKEMRGHHEGLLSLETERELLGSLHPLDKTCCILIVLINTLKLLSFFVVVWYALLWWV